jgi:lipase
MAQHLTDLAPIVARLGPDTVVLGHSYGGLIAWELARAMPEALRGLILVDPAISVSAETQRWGVDNSGARFVWPDERSALDALLAQREAGAWWAAALEFANTLEPASGGGYQTIVRPDVVAVSWANMHQPIRSSPWRGPTLLLEAAQEFGKFFAPASLAVLKSELGDKLDHRLPDVAHTIPSDQPDLLAGLVMEFIGALEPR